MSRIAALLFMSPVALMPGGPELSVSGPSQAVSVSAPSPGEFKCGGRGGSHADMPETVVILDDKVIEVEIPDFDLDFHNLANSDFTFGFVCWRWIEEHYGFQVNSTGLFITTVDWLKRGRDNQLAALGALIAAQDRHREEHGKYAHQADGLPGFGSLVDYGLPTYFELDLKGADDGWSARVTASTGRSGGAKLVPTTGCFAFVGAVPEAWTTALSRDMPAFRERQPMCSEGWDGPNTGPGGR